MQLVEIIFDTLGAEQGIDSVIEAGCHLAVYNNIKICFVGDENQINSRLNSCGLLSHTAIRVINSTSYISMDETPSDAIASKQNASICVAMRQANISSLSAVISPGHSGATVLAAKENWGLLPKISRACLCQILPAANNKHFLISDVGASINTSPDALLGFAIMTVAAAKNLLNISQPRIGLLNIGTETFKGDQRLLETHKLIKNHFPEFIGNIEGHQIWNGDSECVITDGLTGNILLKSVEGFSSLLIQKACSNLPPETCDKFKQFTQQILTSEYHGAVLLGVNGLCIVCHGKASSEDMISAGKLAIKCQQNNLIDTLAQFLVDSRPRTSNSTI